MEMAEKIKVTQEAIEVEAKIKSIQYYPYHRFLKVRLLLQQARWMSYALSHVTLFICFPSKFDNVICFVYAPYPQGSQKQRDSVE